ncbi:hypothetical protein CCZ01_09625 [Helicobacter monodelphidis]|nr:hypothetical protein CCZ01_09625 [Helicobacter sp. 15-1451]
MGWLYAGIRLWLKCNSVALKCVYERFWFLLDFLRIKKSAHKRKIGLFGKIRLKLARESR